MSQQTAKKKRKSINFWLLILTVFTFGYMLFRTMPSLFAMAFKFVLPESIIIKDSVETKGLILKKEALYRAEGNGTIDIIKPEGERLARGSEVCKIQVNSGESNIQQEIKELDEKIQALKAIESERDILKGDEGKLGNNIDNLILEIQEKINAAEYDKAEILKEKLALYYGKQQDISGGDHLISTSIENLEKKRDSLGEKVNENSITYYTNEAGIVSYKIDGYEEIFSFSNKEDYNYSNMKFDSANINPRENGDKVQFGEHIFKIIDNYEWYAMLKIDNFKEISSYEEGDRILLEKKGTDEEFNGKIIRIDKEGSKGTILCKFNSNFMQIYDERFVNFDIIRYKHEGYKIPTKALVDKDGIKGVYIKEISGIVRFKPVEIIKEEDKFVYISSGENNTIVINEEDEPVKTITAFDEILLNTKGVKEGIIIH